MTPPPDEKPVAAEEGATGERPGGDLEQKSANQALRLFLYFGRTYPLQSGVTVICLVIASALEGVGLAAAIPLLTLVIQGEEAATGMPDGIESTVREVMTSVGLPFTLLSVALAISAALWLKAGMMVLAKRQVGYTMAFIATDLRQNLLRALLAARWGYFTRQPLGRLTNSIATEATRAGYAYHNLALTVQQAASTLLGIGVAFAVSWELAVASVLGGVIIAGLLHVLVRLGWRAGLRQTNLINTLMARLSEVLLNVRVLKATGRDSLIAPMLARDTDRLRKAMRKEVFAREALRALQEPMVLGLVLAVLIFAQSTAVVSFERVSVLMFALTRGLNSATKIQRRYQLAVINGSGLWSMLSLIRSAEVSVEESHGGRPPTLNEGIEVAGLRMRYDGHALFDDLALEIPAGEITALVGGSGSGKTTLIDLITGLANPDAGSIRLDGVSLDDVDMAAWRRRIGFVPQDAVLLHGTVRTNVTLDDEAVTDAMAIEALKAAEAWEFVSRLPGGLDATVGERGTLVSGGQRARIALARALAHDPALVILDEATAALDPETEEAVWRSLERLRGRVTVLAVSHQPALSAVADRIYRIEDGRAEQVEASVLREGVA